MAEVLRGDAVPLHRGVCKHCGASLLCPGPNLLDNMGKCEPACPRADDPDELLIIEPITSAGHKRPAPGSDLATPAGLQKVQRIAASSIGSPNPLVPASRPRHGSTRRRLELTPTHFAPFPTSNDANAYLMDYLDTRPPGNSPTRVVDAGAHRGDADDNEMDHHDDIAMTTATHDGGRRLPAAIDSDANDDMMAYVGDRTMAGATSQAKERDDASEGRDSQGGTRSEAAQPRRRGKTIRKAKGGQSVKAFVPNYAHDDI